MRAHHPAEASAWPNAAHVSTYPNTSSTMKLFSLCAAAAAEHPSGSASRRDPWARSGRSTARGARRRGWTLLCCQKAKRWELDMGAYWMLRLQTCQHG